jgi:hypothetical protein
MYCINQYDIRMKKEPSPECGMAWPHELHDVTKYLTVRIQTEWLLFIFRCCNFNYAVFGTFVEQGCYTCYTC